MKRICLIGASGLIGSELLNLLIDDKEIEKIIIFARSELKIKHSKIFLINAAFDVMDSYASQFNADIFISCLGSTIKQAKSQANFRRIDYDFNVNFARIAYRKNAKRFILVSTINAHALSSNFYTRIKGETEDSIRKCDIESIIIFRPSLLDGKRQEFRFFERMAIFTMRLLNPLLIGRFKKYRSIKALTVAKAIQASIHDNLNGLNILESDEIQVYESTNQSE